MLFGIPDKLEAYPTLRLLSTAVLWQSMILTPRREYTMKFDSSRFGPQALGDDDANAQGATYSEIREALFRNPYYLKYGDPAEPPLPVYEVNFKRVARGLLPGGAAWKFRQAAERAVDSHADMRWGSDRLGYRRLLHPNGVCLLGRWKITEDNPWSGYFQKGSEALIIGRYSTCCTETRRGCYRSLSLVGKLFPTTDENHTTPLRTANFITQEDLGGSRTPFLNDVTCRNAPDVTPWRRGLGIGTLLLSGLLFKVVDREAAIRQLYTIAELGKPASVPTKAPEFLQITVDPGQPRIGDPDSDLDFRDEVLQHIHGPTGKLKFNIEATDLGKVKGLLIKRGTFPKDAWRTIGQIEFTEAACSYNGDFVIHFPHPKWRTDRNDPSSTLRNPAR